MIRNREVQRGNRKKCREERLDTRNDAGYLDLTAYCAVASIREKDKHRYKPINVRLLK